MKFADDQISLFLFDKQASGLVCTKLRGRNITTTCIERRDHDKKRTASRMQVYIRKFLSRTSDEVEQQIERTEVFLSPTVDFCRAP